MDFYDELYCINPYGLVNVSSVCYFNALMQALISCTSLIKSVLANNSYLAETSVGRELTRFINNSLNAQPGGISSGIRLCKTFRQRLAEECPNIEFGAGQQCAAECFLHLLNMTSISVHNSPLSSNPLAHLFLHRARATLVCNNCKKRSHNFYENIQIDTFFIDSLKKYPSNPTDFSEALRINTSEQNDWVCESCKNVGGTRIYQMSMLPEILICVYNLYTQERPLRYYPKKLKFPCAGGGHLLYKLVAQIEQTGSTDSGHYVTIALRAGDKSYLFDDSSQMPYDFVQKSRNIYMCIYHVSDIITENV